jgi:hypothetical protein
MDPEAIKQLRKIASSAGMIAIGLWLIIGVGCCGAVLTCGRMAGG